MAGVEIDDFSAPDEVRRPDRTTVEVITIAGREVGRYTFQPGWSWSECIKPGAGTETCQHDHVGYCLSGELRVKHGDGSTADVTPGSVYHIAPGHDSEVVGDEPFVSIEFQGTAEFAGG